MELSPNSNPDAESSTRVSRRKSGRVSNAPDRLVASSAPKRKRDDVDEEDDEDNENDAEMDEQDEDEDEGDDENEEPDAEEIKDKKRRAQRAGGTKANASKRAKTTKTPAVKNVAAKPAKQPKARARVTKKGAKLDAAEDVGGLYGESYAMMAHHDQY